MKCSLVGAPVQSGASQAGCLMGPDGFRTAGLESAIRQLGHEVSDLGNVTPMSVQPTPHSNKSVHGLEETIGWALALEQAAFDAAVNSDLPIFLGGDHSLSIGTVPGVTRYSNEQGREQFVLWLDAHPDFHSLNSTKSGNLHGTPVAYFSRCESFVGVYPELKAAVKPENICMMGIRSVDEAENQSLAKYPIVVHDMRALDEHGIVKPLKSFLDKVQSVNGALHVSFDVDFLEPDIAPAVGTTVPGGATFREAHLIMEMLCDSGLVSSLDLVELNPFLDERGRTATLMVDLVASLLGRKVLDRPTRSF
ncbi:MAG: arginase [Rhizobiaceae bacterium]